MTTSSDRIMQLFPLTPAEIAYKESYLHSSLNLMDSPMSFFQYQAYVEEGLCVTPLKSNNCRDLSIDHMGYCAAPVEESFSGDTVQLIPHERYSYPIVHSHSFIEIIYVYHGCCTHFVDKRSFTLNEGDLCILAPDVMHAPSVIDDDTIVLNLLISKNVFDQNFLNLLRGGNVMIHFFESYFYQKETFSPYIIYPTGDDSEMHELFYKMYREAQDQKYAYQRKLFILAESMFIHLIRKYEMMAYVSSEIENTFNSHIVSILGYISFNYSRANLKDTADFFGYTSAYLSRMIKKYTGYTYSAIVEEYQMEHAEKLLATTDLSITEISLKIGCFDASHFTKKFKKYFGLSPSDFRQKHPLSTR